ncbi:MAG: FAD-dependent oxidoreductase [Hyphomicrobiaceae bacterium]|nr:FAD-dependent oxidoreductase [Hyphomicrobiaceae bacterium]
MSLPSRAQVIVIGGGIIGCSTAYHLTKMGVRDVVLLERKQLTSGTTWHAAGLVRSMLYTQNLTRLAKYTVDLYTRLEAETGQPTGFVQPGSISIATNSERWEELLRGVGMLHTFGVEAEPITPREAREKWPLMSIHDVVGAVWYPRDGKCNPIDTCLALARGARTGGARIFESTAVRKILVENGRAVGVETDKGRIRAETVVNCAGMWARDLGRSVGVAVPLQACEHFYIVTETMEGMHPDLPVMRDMDHCAYYKEDAGKLLLGAFEPVAKPWALDGIPEDFAFGELPEDVEHFQPVLEDALRRVPSLAKVGIRKFFNGPESFSADGRYILGPAPELDRFFVCAGFNSIGIQSGGGAGMALAHWIVEGEPPFDLWDVDIGRFHPHQNAKSFLVPRVSESLGLLYAMHWPYRQYESSRGVRTSPLHERLRAAGASFGEVAGYERPSWFARPGQSPEVVYSWGRQNWFENARDEHVAVRERVGLFDQSCFAKFRVNGCDALKLLDRISCNRIDVAPGRVVYTQWLNAKGGIEADLTVQRVAADDFLVITACATQLRDRRTLEGSILPEEQVTVTDVSAAYAMLGLMGPLSRDVLASLTTADLSSAAFPFATSQTLEIAAAPVRATRITYVGELGYELLVPADYAVRVFDAISAAGGASGLRFAGYHAMNSLRIEKAYRHWGHDVTPDDTPLEAGLGFCVAWDRPGGFIGREALLARRGKPMKSVLVQFLLEDAEPLLYHDEPIWREGVRVGRIASGMYGYTLGGAVGLGYVHLPEPAAREIFAEGRYEIEVAGRKFPARASIKPLYDPTSARVRA